MKNTKGLVTNYGEREVTKQEGGKVLAMLKGGGHKKFWVSFYAVA